MKIHKGLCAAAAFFAALAVAPVAGAQEAEDQVVAKVNGYEIRTSEVKLAADDIMPQLSEVPPQLRYAFVVEYLIERHLLAQAAVKDGVDASKEYKRRLAFYQAKSLRDAYFESKIEPTVTDAELQEIYQEEAQKVNSAERVRARHILVETEDEAKQVLEQVKAGQNFEELARRMSKDGSAQYGGDLGFFTADEMVPEFSQMAFTLQPGQVSEPVKTEYGWHIIKVEERKLGGAEPFDKVKNGLKLIVLRKKVQETVADLRQGSEVELIDPDLQRLQARVEELRRGQQDQQDQQEPQPQ